MLIKGVDERAAELATIERLLLSEPPWHQAKALRSEQRKLFRQIEHKRAAAVRLDGPLADNRLWAVIHDLRLEMGEQSMHIDHLLINRWFDCYLIDSRHCNKGLGPTEGRGWQRARERLQKQGRFLYHYLSHNGLLPERLGMALKPRIHPVVLGRAMVPGAVECRARDGEPLYLNCEQLIRHITSPLHPSCSRRLAGILRHISSDSLRTIGTRLAQRHLPPSTDYVAQHDVVTDVREMPAAAYGQAAECAACSEPVPLSTQRYCEDNREMFDGRIYCPTCQRVTAFHPVRVS